ncbi:MAG: sulfatase-like hydrolase/transferase [Deltaproteobacteria bacterium]|nr:sulfatase-like hydrolase/transferase [Deltaproteobacteria bacterium]
MIAELRRLGWRLLIAFAIAAFALNFEGDRVLAAAGAEIAGEWDGYAVARGAPAIASLAFFVPLLVIVAFSAFVTLLDARRGRVAWAVAMALIAVPFALELSTGRKAQVPAVRLPFVLGVTAASAVLAGVVGPLAIAAWRRARWLALAGGFATIVTALELDRRVLPRLYPLFHHALIVVAAIGFVLVAQGVIDAIEEWRRGPRALDALALIGLILLSVSVRRVGRGGRDLAKFDNARRIVDEQSPILARAAALAARRWPPPPLDDAADGPDPLAQSTARAIDATGRDLLLVTIDALRADHVGAYGYPRKTTPAIDALAAEGVLFERAYTATPHTSYAVASLMTGKYMRPILALEAASGGGRRVDETWAGLFRTYGFRTAALYPPALWAVDSSRFAALVERKLDFEYVKEEFARPDLRAKQVGEWLAAAPPGKPLFLWVHLFEPHEPYVAHEAHPFGDAELDRYDSEIAAADAGLGAIVKSFRATRPGAVVIVSADHGEAFGEHGARYHGTTVFEEQVRVPLVISAPGLVAHRRVDRPVQLVDLLPTVLSAYAIPKPPRVRGVDLGELLASREPPPGEGVAFAEVEDMAMLARGSLRLVCNRRTATCPLYDLSTDPLQLQALPGDARADRLRREMAAIIAGSARLEGFAGSDAASWPEALRRGYAGDRDAAVDVAGLLDDVDVAFRRRAAEVLVRLAHPETEAAIRRAASKEPDEATRRWLAIARVRTARETPCTAAELGAASRLIETPEVGRWAALAVGEGVAHGAPTPGPIMQAKAFDVLVDWFPTARADADLGRAILDVLPTLLRGSAGTSGRRATKALRDALGDIRLRVLAAETLGRMGDPEAAKDLEKMLAEERHVDARAPEAVALARVGQPERALMHLARFLGVPEPAPGAVNALTVVAPFAEKPPWLAFLAMPGKQARPTPIPPKGDAHRLVIAGPPRGTLVRAKIEGKEYDASVGDDGAIIELGARFAGRVNPVAVDVSTEAGSITAVALIARVPDLPPPKPDRGLEEDAAP